MRLITHADASHHSDDSLFHEHDSTSSIEPSNVPRVDVPDETSSITASLPRVAVVRPFTPPVEIASLPRVV